MIPRYTRKEMSEIWEIENKFNIWLDIECFACEAMSELGIIPKQSAINIKKNAKFNISRINELEKKTRHDVVAFLENVSESIGEDSKYLHKGMTSSDILDTTLSIQLKQASDLIIQDIKKILHSLKKRSIEHRFTPIIGRSHGMHAETTTFGLKLAGFYAEFKRNLFRIQIAKNEISTCAISGPVGNYTNINPKVEKYIADKFGLMIEPVSTQVIPRDRHAVFFSTLAILSSSIERLATEIRNLQRTEIFEVEEYFHEGQKGSSAMPHKRNPVLSENLTGLSRYIRGMVIPALENISLWHERDISHSSVERIIAPDATIAIDFALCRLEEIINNLIVYPDNMKKNINKLKGLHNSHNVLLSLIDAGVEKNIAYEIVQKASNKTWNDSISFKDTLLKFSECKKYIGEKKIEQILENEDYKKHINTIFNRIFND